MDNSYIIFLNSVMGQLPQFYEGLSLRVSAKYHRFRVINKKMAGIAAHHLF
jgi:hypothetical protein